MKKLLMAFFLIAIGVAGRTVFHIAPNVEFVTLASLLAATYLGRRYAILVPFVIMVITDTLIGNTNIFIFTWSAWVMIGFSGLVLRKIKGRKLIGAVFASLFFYFYTNFGVWLLDAWGMYSRDFSGLTHCYLMGLPFLKLNLFSNLIFVPAGFSVVEIIFRKEKVFSLDKVKVARILTRKDKN
jgi:hypothetical protein